MKDEEENKLTKRRAGYHALHEWVKRRTKKPGFCDKCGGAETFGKDGRSLLDLANKSGDYKKDLSDWMWLCRRCHVNNDLGWKKKKWANGVMCKRGHVLSAVGFYTDSRGIRCCKKCSLNRSAFRDGYIPVELVQLEIDEAVAKSSAILKSEVEHLITVGGTDVTVNVRTIDGEKYINERQLLQSLSRLGIEQKQ